VVGGTVEARGLGRCGCGLWRIARHDMDPDALLGEGRERRGGVRSQTLRESEQGDRRPVRREHGHTVGAVERAAGGPRNDEHVTALRHPPLRLGREIGVARRVEDDLRRPEDGGGRSGAGEDPPDQRRADEGGTASATSVPQGSSL
jgi:hypothetical protein